MIICIYRGHESKKKNKNKLSWKILECCVCNILEKIDGNRNKCFLMLRVTCAIYVRLCSHKMNRLTGNWYGLKRRLSRVSQFKPIKTKRSENTEFCYNFWSRPKLLCHAQRISTKIVSRWWPMVDNAAGKLTTCIKGPSFTYNVYKIRMAAERITRTEVDRSVL